ncbi:hypothetical protein KP509_15G047400 [Ceratopteris richardii]|uniref:Uncharacterized protein n=1 Tax=Ceratopteris richardii TaxID=49495 RepID=A0A8T2T7E6_CERRI|nr:hypothetical protein KP509_15G047400 [Ceratopteris richardii]
MDRGGSWASMTTDSLLVNMLQAAPHQVAWIQETKLNVLKCLCLLNGSNSLVYCLYMNIQQILAIPSGDCVHCPCPLLETKIYIKCYCFAAYRLLSLKFSEWVLHSGLILSAHMVGVEGSLLDTKAGGAL